MSPEKAIQVVEMLYKNIHTFSFSFKGREEQKLEGSQFVYGEITPAAFYAFISKANPKPGEIFFDLGSGAGKAVILAYLAFDFAESNGIELVNSLYDASVVLKETLPQLNIMKDELDDLKNKSISFLNGSVTEISCQHADIIYMNCTTWSEDTLDVLFNKQFSQLRPGTRILSVDKCIATLMPDHSVKLMDTQPYTFSWGTAQLHTQIKQ
jgi:hypothetical protein